MELYTAKGARDYPPQEELLREHIRNTIKEQFHRYGFDPLETPILERFEVLAAKYAGGDEILKETFQLQDQGGRELGLRYDLTVPLARFVGMNPQLKLPFKRYQMGPVFRDGPIEQGRLRQFWQCDADIVGAPSPLPEIECLSLASDVYHELNIPVRIETNHVQLIRQILSSVGINDNQASIILTLDKLKKIGKKGVNQELEEKGMEDEQINELLDIFTTQGDRSAKQELLTDKVDQDVLEAWVGLLDRLEDLGIPVQWNLSLARGLSYYTGMIYEFYATDHNLDSSLGSGGRYDNMIGEFLEGRHDYPAIGVSFGMDRMYEVLKGEHGQNTTARLLVVPIGETVGACLSVTQKLRQQGLRVTLDLMGRSISKNLSYADGLNIPYVLLVGEKEVQQQKYTLKDMKSGEQQSLTEQQIVSHITQTEV